MIDLNLKLIPFDIGLIYTNVEQIQIQQLTTKIRDLIILDYSPLILEGGKLEKISAVTILNSEPYKDCKEMLEQVRKTKTILISDLYHPVYLTELNNINTRILHDVLHVVGYLQHGRPDFNTFTELYVYKLLTTYVLNCPYLTKHEKSIFLDYHYADFVGQTILYHQEGKFMDSQLALTPEDKNYSWLSFHVDNVYNENL